jgi:3-deoxy-manno-octulosonate cytidylyltransferase (CMP-KDO synthetase)
MKAIAIIPARMGSSRFPGKPLVSILGLPMVMHVYFRARMSRLLSEVYIATPDEEIRRVTESFGVPTIMTSPLHERCTDRIAEAADAIATDADVVVNIQGDEPMLYPEVVDRMAPLTGDPSVACIHPIAPIEDEETFENRNVIKVVIDVNGRMMFMTREPVPTLVRLGEAVRRWQLIPIYGFRRDFLREYTQLPQTPLEQAESVDSLRILEHGRIIATFPVEQPTIAVDVPSDVARVEEVLRSDPLAEQYLPQVLERWRRGVAR